MEDAGRAAGLAAGLPADEPAAQIDQRQQNDLEHVDQAMPMTMPRGPPGVAQPPPVQHDPEPDQHGLHER